MHTGPVTGRETEFGGPGQMKALWVTVTRQVSLVAKEQERIS